MEKLRRPEYDIYVTLLCPVCERKLKTNICEECGCVINTSSFNVEIDINPQEIL